ncbi:MAG: carbohydrate kinase [Firmicutes bacterium]|nr:carbohydrate kinase [Bacillota bacterium]
MKPKNEPIVILGETLFDFYFDSVRELIPGQKQIVLHGSPGGAPANVAANLAGMNKRVSLISAFSDDLLGASLRKMLLERGINLDHSITFSGTRTPFAVVMNTPEGERGFNLYLRGSALELIDKAKTGLSPEVEFFHFGSVLLVFEAGVKVTETFLKQLEASRAIRSYDINIRPDILKDYPQAPKAILDVLGEVDLLKISDEDLRWIAKNVDGSLAKPEDYFSFGIKLLAYTAGPQGALLLTPSQRCFVPPPEIEVIDTTGGGDAFVAGMLAELQQNRVVDRNELALLDQRLLKKIGLRATRCAAKILAQAGGMPPVI